MEKLTIAGGADLREEDQCLNLFGTNSDFLLAFIVFWVKKFNYLNNNTANFLALI
jgi:hypothetical protein